jgi:hypothetical protein
VKRTAIFGLFVLLFFVFANGIAFAHGDHGHDHEHGHGEDLLEIYQALTATFQNHLLSTESLTPSSIGYIEVGDGRRVAFNQSAMNELMALAVMDYDVEGHSCNAKCRESWLTKVLKFTVKLPFNIVHHAAMLPVKAIKFMGQPVTNSKELMLAIEGFARRTARGYDPTLFILILVSQGAWETIESVVMPAGVHLFCTVFNTALLTATIPLERISKLASNANEHLTLAQRLRYSVLSLFSTLKLWASDSRTMYVDKEHGREMITKNSFQIKNANQLESILTKNGFFQSVYAANMIPRQEEFQPAFNYAALERDLEFIFNSSELSSARMYVAFSHTRGLSVLVKQLEKLAAEVREQKLLPRKAYLQLEDYTGRMRKVVSNYSASLLLYGAGDVSAEAQQELKGKYLRLLHHMIESFSTHGEQLHVLHEQKGVEAFTVHVEAANKEAIGLLNRLKVLRSNRAPYEALSPEVMEALACANIFYY